MKRPDLAALSTSLSKQNDEEALIVSLKDAGMNQMKKKKSN